MNYNLIYIKKILIIKDRKISYKNKKCYIKNLKMI